MKMRTPFLATALLLAMTACHQPAEPVAESPAADAASPKSELPVAETDSAATSTPSTTGECAFNLEGNDAMQFNVKNIDVPRSCAQFTINLKHIGSMPVAAMGHNVVIAKTADIGDVAADGSAVQPDYVMAGDTRVIAHSEMVGGGQSTTVTFDVSKLSDGGYSFFCTFPGHSGMMQGTLSLK